MLSFLAPATFAVEYRLTFPLIFLQCSVVSVLLCAYLLISYYASATVRTMLEAWFFWAVVCVHGCILEVR